MTDAPRPDDLPGLDELADLLAAERTAPVTDAAARAMVRARLATTVGHAALGSAAAGTATVLGTAGKVIAVLAVVAGAGGMMAVHRTRAPAAEAEAATAPAVAAAPVAATLAARVAATAPAAATSTATAAAPVAALATASHPAPVVTRATPRAIVARRASAPPPPSEPPSFVPSRFTEPPPPPPTELSLLHDAWRSLATGDPARALAFADADRVVHPDGALAEERDALRVVALAGVDRGSARVAAADFVVRFPHSMHRALVERAVKAPAPHEDSP